MNDKDRQFSGVMDCVRTILKNEGPMAFYKGFGMCWMRVSPSRSGWYVRCSDRLLL